MTSPTFGFFGRLRHEAACLAVKYCEALVLDLDLSSFDLLPFPSDGEFRGQVKFTTMTPGFQVQYLFLTVEPIPDTDTLRITIPNFNPQGTVYLSDLKHAWKKALTNQPKRQSQVVAEAIYDNWKRDGKL